MGWVTPKSLALAAAYSLLLCLALKAVGLAWDSPTCLRWGDYAMTGARVAAAFLVGVTLVTPSRPRERHGEDARQP
jgi:hypothetical protein